MDIENMVNQLFVQQQPGFYALMSLESEYVCANKVTSNVMGFKTIDGIIGRKYYEMNCPAVENANIFFESDQRVILENREKCWLSRFCFADNQWIVLYGSKKPLRNDQGTVIGVISHFYNIGSAGLIDMTRFLVQKDSKFIQHEFVYDIGSEVYEYNLSKRQTECLFFVLRGKSAKQIGLILSISSKTVETYVEQLKIKLNCFDKSHLIEKCIDLGLMNFIPRSLIKPDLKNTLED